MLSTVWGYVYILPLIIVTFCRISQDKRKFNDDCLQQAIREYKQHLSPDLYKIFQNSFPNTLDTTILTFNEQQPLTYIITGDIHAMWLRDSTNQIIPYLRMARTCPRIKQLVLGLINMQAKLIMIDPYTNAFCQNYTQKTRPFYLNDKTTRRIMGVPVDLSRGIEFATKSIWQRKYQIDSLAAFLRLLYQYERRYRTIDWVSVEVIKAIKQIMSVVQVESEQDDATEHLNGVTYTFKRDMRELPMEKMASGSKNGMVRSAFRPSDDANKYPYNVPGNAMLSTYLWKVAEILKKVDTPFYKAVIRGLPAIMEKYSKRINESIFTYGVFKHNNKSIFAYQVDGKGNWLNQQDPNLPSLLSMPYLQFISQFNPIYLNTRKFIFSKANPYYFTGNQSYMTGLGSTHTDFGYVWPISRITQALTSTSQEEIKDCVEFLRHTSHDGFVHESVNVNQTQAMTRVWFAWANSYFGELMIYLVERYPHLVK